MHSRRILPWLLVSAVVLWACSAVADSAAEGQAQDLEQAGAVQSGGIHVAPGSTIQAAYGFGYLARQAAISL